MKPIIGILPSFDIEQFENPFASKYVVSNICSKVIVENDAIPIGLIMNDGVLQIEQLDLCDGFLLPGGKHLELAHFQLLQYAIEKNKPILGICLGMQAMAVYDVLCDITGGKSLSELEMAYQDLKDKKRLCIQKLSRPNIHGEKIMNGEIDITLEHILDSHHKITCNPNSKIYSIYKNSCIEVISLHSCYINRLGSHFITTAVAEDGVIEAIEYNDPDYFIIGVQYHPEFEEKKLLLKWFINKCQNEVKN